MNDLIEAFDRARGAFDAYAGMGEGALPRDAISERQVRLCREYGSDPMEDLALSLEALKTLAEQAAIAATRDPSQDPSFERMRVARALRTLGTAMAGFATRNRLDLGELLR